VLMLVLLAGAVAAAWLVSEARYYDPRAAVDLLADIRRQGLGSYWPDEPSENWYLVYGPQGRAVGWSVERRVGRADGGFAGARIEEYDGVLSIERWQLDDSAATGEYRADQWQFRNVRVSGRPVKVSVKMPATEIQLTAGGVGVLRSDGERKVSAEASDPPANYIPEGLSNLAIYQAALKGRKTEFLLIQNSAAISGKSVVFTPLRVKPVGGRVVELDLGNYVKTIAFDETGRMVRSADSQGGQDAQWMELSTAEAVASRFPRARRYLRPTTAPAEPETQPATREAEDNGGMKTED